MDKQQLIGSISELQEGGKGLRFQIKDKQGDVFPAFLIRYDYQVFAYLNRCGHIAVELDFLPGDFFSDDGQTLVCATHGAEYAPDTGACLGGPCFGVGLESLSIVEIDGQAFLKSEDYTLAQ